MAGFLSSYVANKLILGAIPLAVSHVNSDPTLLRRFHRTLEFVPADTGDADKGRHRVSRHVRIAPADTGRHRVSRRVRIAPAATA